MIIGLLSGTCMKLINGTINIHEVALPTVEINKIKPPEVYRQAFMYTK